MKVQQSNRILFYSLALVLIFTLSAQAESSSSSGGGFSIAPPPLGYADYYGEVSPKRHRLDVAYQYYDLEVSEVQGGSVYADSRIIGGAWGSVSLQYGGFYLWGEDKDADAGMDVDLTVSGFNVVPSVEFILYRSSGSAGRGTMLTSFFGIDGGYQFFTQDFESGKDSYHSRFIGPLGGLQAHIPAGEVLISPFVMAKHLWGEADSGNISFDYTTFTYGFDVVWRGFSLSGILQNNLDSDDKVYTVSMGFSF